MSGHTHVRIGNLAVQLARVCCFEDLGEDGVRVHFVDPCQPITLTGEGATDARDYMSLMPKAREAPLPAPSPMVTQGRSVMQPPAGKAPAAEKRG